MVQDYLVVIKQTSDRKPINRRRKRQEKVRTPTFTVVRCLLVCSVPDDL